MIPDEQKEIFDIIEETLNKFSYQVSDECMATIAQEIWDAFEGVILNGYA